MQVEFWGIFHDGSISNIDSSVQGDLTIDISIQYIRRQFPGAGDGFKVKLHNCTRFEYQEYDSQVITDFSAIVAMDPELLSLESASDPIVINCVMGTLTTSYSSASVSLDSGEPVSYNDLTTACASYWDAWEANHKPAS